MKMWRSSVAALGLLMIASCVITVLCEPQVPCYFVFGDSLSDVGNNNNLATTAKANYPPYGIDFPGGVATGRFSNGLNYVDRITQLIGFDEFIPPYSTASGRQIIKGVNYASGSAGIRDETGQQLGAHISMNQQLANHGLTILKLALMMGFSVQDHLNKCLYTVNIGSNDYINNYFMPQYYPSSKMYTPEQYAEVLINQFSRQLKTLYTYGARKVGVFGVGLIGCTLAEVYKHGPSNGSLCVDEINDAVNLFNAKLVSLVDDLNSKLSGATFTYLYTSSSDTGSLIANATCCKVLRADNQCQENSPVCPNRNDYVFWDGFHPTQLVDIATGDTAYSSTDPSVVHPVNIQTLISSDQVLLMSESTTEGSSYSI